jgi:hypothetical protein
MKLAILPVCGLAALSHAAPAQAQDWDFSASLYLYMAETETSIGNRSSTLSFSDALDNLDDSFMGLIEGNNDQWGFILNYMMTDISFDGSTPGQAVHQKLRRVRIRLTPTNRQVRQDPDFILATCLLPPRSQPAEIGRAAQIRRPVSTRSLLMMPAAVDT